MPTSYLLSLNKKAETEINEVASDLDKVGQSTFKLLKQIFKKFKSENVKIITNASQGWIPKSLQICKSYCYRIYQEIENLIFIEKKIEIIYARNYSLNKCYWKRVCFDKLLRCYFENNNHYNHFHVINVITIGDQWHDHKSIEETETYMIYNEEINHHQIKLFSEKPDCRYLSVEINYIISLLDLDILFVKQGATLEFDGYN